MSWARATSARFQPEDKHAAFVRVQPAGLGEVILLSAGAS